MSVAAKPQPGFPWLVIALAIPALAVLLALGTWQVQRLAWKENLIATVERRMAADPLPILEATFGADQSEGIDYRPVTLSGTFVPDEVFFEFTTHKGISGWNLFHLLEYEPDQRDRGLRYTIVNRGFIPYDMRDTWREVAPLPTDAVEVAGLLRMPLTGKPGFALPDNEIEERTFYWRSTVDMAVAAGIEPEVVTAWYVDEGMPGNGKLGDWPVTGTTIVTFSNNHLQYAITWYGLALTLVGVVGFFVYGRMRGGKT
ncbi:MAG: SURF1 family protein [Pseudomonadota bacterium]